MNKKFGLLLILILGSLLIAAIIYYVFYFSATRPSAKIEESQSVPQALDTVKTIESPKTESVEVEQPVMIKRNIALFGQANLERMARSFAERFGSFSNQSNFSNITDLKMVMSDDMRDWAAAYIEKNQKPNLANEVYYGLTTKALSTNVKSFDDLNGGAEIIVETRRREAIGTTSNASKLFNQEIIITFIKENQAWRVDSAYWQD